MIFMKKLYYIFSLLILASSFALVGCSDDDSNKTVDITFPELETVSHKIGDTGTITFEATSSWKLTSSALWLVFMDEDMEEDEMYGQPGKHTINYVVKEDGANFGSSHKASVALTMNNQRQVIYQITREPLSYQVTATDIDGNVVNAENPFILNFGKATTLKLTANYAFKAEFPKWIEVQNGLSGEANKEVTILIKPAAGFAKNPNEGVFSVTNATFDAAATFEFPITYAGMDPMLIEFNHVPWNWEFHADGLQYSKTTIDGDVVTYDLPMNFSVTALNDDYKIVAIEFDSQWGCTILNEYTEWFYVEDKKAGNIAVTASQNMGAERIGTLLIFPAAKFAEFGSNLDAALFDDQNGVFYLKSGLEKYTALDFKQKGQAGATPFTVLNEGLEMELAALADQIGEAEVIAQYGTKEVYVLGVENRVYDNIEVHYNSVNAGTSIYPETYFNGNNTAWKGVETDVVWTDGYTKNHTIIKGIKENSANGTQMVISFINGSTESALGIILVEQY